MGNRTIMTIMLASAAGFTALHRLPFPAENAALELVRWHEPSLFASARAVYITMLFTTPYIFFSLLGSLVYIFLMRPSKDTGLPRLPPYPDPAGRKTLFLVIGELHHPKRPVPVPEPKWLAIPDRGLYTGIMILGAIGTGKTSGCMHPFCEQVFAYRASDKNARIGGLVLEVKGDFCHKVKTILEKHGRGSDYLEISLDSPYRYNPLYNDLDAYALAYGIASLLNNLFGKGKEPFWQQAYTNLVKFVILLHKVLYNYVTLFNVYEGVINPGLLEQKIKEGEELFSQDYVLVTIENFMRHSDLESYPFERDPEANRMKAPCTQELHQHLNRRGIEYEFQTESGNSAGNGHAPWDETKREQFEAVKRWFYQDWSRIEPKLRTSIVEGISVFLSLFDDNPAVKRVFCPPKETYDPVANADGRYGRPLPPFSELIESGTVCALNFPVSANPGLAKTIGTLM
jgi:hypothetical protein